MRRSLRLASLVCASSSLLLACSSAPPPEADRAAVRAAAALVTDDAPPMDAPPLASTDTPIVQWNDAALQAVRVTHPGPPIVARALAMLHTAMYDAWSAYDAVAIGTRLGGSLRRPAAERTLANETTALSFAADAVLTDLFPTQAASFHALRDALAAPGTTTGAATSPDGVGLAVARALLDYRHADRSNQAGGYADTTGYVPVNTPDTIVDMYHWQPLRVSDGRGGFVVQSFVTPQWSQVTPFALTSGDEYRPGKNDVPAKNWGHYKKLADEVLAYSAALTDEQKVIAEYWADGPRSELPPGHWTLFAEYVSRRDHHDLAADAKMFFAMTNATFDASIAAWDAKRFYDYARPITVVQSVFAGQSVTAWAGPYQGTKTIPAASWRPYQPVTVVTPPFPEFFSGHSVFSAAAAEVLKSFTGSDAFGASYTQPKGVSTVEPGATPAHDVTLSWATFSDAADQAGISRRYGGIHFSEGDLQGRKVGRLVGAQAWAAAQQLWNGRDPATCHGGAITCCANGVACVGAKCAARCDDCAACGAQYCCAPNANGQPVTCSATPSCP